MSFPFVAKSEIDIVFSSFEPLRLSWLDLQINTVKLKSDLTKYVYLIWNKDERNQLLWFLKTCVLSIQIIRLRVEDYYLEFYGGRHSKPHAYVEKHSWQSISTDFVVNFFWLIQWKKRERRRSCKVYQVFFFLK